MTDQAHTIHNLTSSPRGGGIKWFLLVPAVLCGAGVLTFTVADDTATLSNLTINLAAGLF